jgi:hypothetical protein
MGVRAFLCLKNTKLCFHIQVIPNSTSSQVMLNLIQTMVTLSEDRKLENIPLMTQNVRAAFINICTGIYVSHFPMLPLIINIFVSLCICIRFNALF